MVRRLQRIADIAEEDLKKNFDSEGRHFGAPWPLLAEETQEHRDFLAQTFGLPIGPDHPILVNFGDFRESVVSKHGKGHERRVDQFTVRIASTHKKSKMKDAMATLVDQGKGKAPKRRIIHPKGATPAAMRLMEQELEEHADAVARIVEGG